MRVSLRYPSSRTLREYHNQQRLMPFSYEEVGASARSFPGGYQHDRYRFIIGHGTADWERAKDALCHWCHFNLHWTRLYPSPPPVAVDEVVIVNFRLLGLWWKNSCRIISVTNKADHFGFTYGTLTDHVECGEEYFGVAFDPQNEQVYFVLEAFSKPYYWLARWAGPITRYFQKQFAPQAAEAMRLAIQ